jgi:adenylyltransferase/sulfurtransferase
MELIMPANNRYSRQILLKNIQLEGQIKLKRSKILVIGCGALGTTIANNLVRSGIGYIKLIDRDIIELNNLQRQNLFNENDIGLPKAFVASKKLKEINSKILIEYIVDDVNYQNIEHFIKEMDIVLDGTDNFLVRFLINDACIKHHIPWVYGGAIESNGMTMNIIPDKTPCFRCLIPNLPSSGDVPTCDTVGVLNSIPTIIASIQSTEAIKILLNKDVNQHLLMYDVWSHSFQNIEIKKNLQCECCNNHNYEFLNAKHKETMISLCGKGAIQVTPVKNMKISFEELEKKLTKIGEVENRGVILRLKIPNFQLNVFRNGRAIIVGTNDKKIAKSLYAKYIGL